MMLVYETGSAQVWRQEVQQVDQSRLLTCIKIILSSIYIIKHQIKTLFLYCSNVSTFDVESLISNNMGLLFCTNIYCRGKYFFPVL